MPFQAISLYGLKWFFFQNAYYECYFVVSLDETLKLLCKYRFLTNAKIDRVTFCDLLHDWFGMTDDYFMDKGS